MLFQNRHRLVFSALTLTLIFAHSAGVSAQGGRREETPERSENEEAGARERGADVELEDAQNDVGDADSADAAEGDSNGDDEAAPETIVPPSLIAAESPTLSFGFDVELVILISEEGEVLEASLHRAEGVDPAIAEEAIRVAKLARFEPARRNGRPMATKVLYVVRFEPPAPEQADELERESGEAKDSSSAPLGAEAGEDASEERSASRARRADEDDAIEVVVTGARSEELATQSAARVDVITRRDIEEGGVRNAGEALEEMHGVHINRTFRGMEIWMRGMDPEYNLVLMDGAVVPGRVGGAIDLSRFGAEELERIEVVRGPSSALYGSEAIGGVVNLITREPRHDFRASGMMSLGSRKTNDATLRLEGKLAEGLRIGVHGGYHGEDAFRFDPSSITTNGSARTQGTVGGNLSYHINERNRLTARLSYLYLKLEGVEAGAGGALFDRTQLQEQFASSVEHRYTQREKIEFTQRATYTQFREQTLVDQRESSQLDKLEDHREHMLQYTGIVRLPFSEDHDLTLGAEPTFHYLDSARLPDRGERYRVGVFTQYDGRVWKPKFGELRIVPALRGDIDSQFGSQLSPKLATRLDVRDQLTVRASYGRGFRAPSFQQLLLRFENPSVGYVIEGNPNLEAERSHGVDVGFTYRPWERLQIGGNFYRNDLTDMIAIVTSPAVGGGDLITYDNLARAWTMGAEADVSLRILDGLGVKAGYTFTETRDVENDRFLEGRPRHRITGSLRGEIAKIDLLFTARLAAQLGRVYYAGGTDQVDAGAIIQADIRAEKGFGDRVALFLGVDNIFDSGDSYLVLRPRTIYGGLGFRYDKGGEL